MAAEPFYTDPDCQRLFCSFLHTLVHRVSTLTGVQYRCAGRRRLPVVVGVAAAAAVGSRSTRGQLTAGAFLY